VYSTFRKNSVPRPIFAPVDVGPRSGHRWIRLSGLSRRQIADLLLALRLGIGNKLANRTTGYFEVKLCGAPSGPLSKSLLAANAKKSDDAATIVPSIVNVAGRCEDSGAG